MGGIAEKKERYGRGKIGERACGKGVWKEGGENTGPKGRTGEKNQLMRKLQDYGQKRSKVTK